MTEYHPITKKINKHFKHAKKIMKWKGTMTNKRANLTLDEIVEGMKETTPKYIVRNGILINFHDILS